MQRSCCGQRPQVCTLISTCGIVLATLFAWRFGFALLGVRHALGAPALLVFGIFLPGRASLFDIFAPHLRPTKLDIARMARDHARMLGHVTDAGGVHVVDHDRAGSLGDEVRFPRLAEREVAGLLG
jgi:hypothetical protein